MDRRKPHESEEAYFNRLEAERRKKAEEEGVAKRLQEEAEALKKTHWMRCPKDGTDLEEIDYLGIKVDRCNHCGGIFLDKGELDALVEATRRQEGLMMKFLQVLLGDSQPPPASKRSPRQKR